MTPRETFSPGLEGVIAGETAISTVAEGLALIAVTLLRSWPRNVVSRKSPIFCFYGELPGKSELGEFQKRVASQTLPPLLGELLRKLPWNAVPMDVLRTGVSILAHYDPELEDNNKAANLHKAERLLGQIPLIIARLLSGIQKPAAGVASRGPRFRRPHVASAERDAAKRFRGSCFSMFR